MDGTRCINFGLLYPRTRLPWLPSGCSTNFGSMHVLRFFDISARVAIFIFNCISFWPSGSRSAPYPFLIEHTDTVIRVFLFLGR